ncbi:hypothetical protein TNCV_2956861 [Trichonephila clavipes]|nr:hypothetical protein TNCV_2956861 [Trichonephila clavipes]
MILLARFHTNLEENIKGQGPPKPSINLTRGLAAQWLFRVAPCCKGTIYINKHPCLLRESNLGPTAQQSESLTTIPDGRTRGISISKLKRIMNVNSEALFEPIQNIGNNVEGF